MSALSVIKSIWKIINLIREIFLNLVFLIIILLIFSGIALIKEVNKQDVIPQSGTLIMDLEGVVVDNSLYSDEIYEIQDKIYGKKVNLSRENSLFDLVQKISQATSDPNIKSLVLKLDNFVGADMSSLQYIGKYLTKFKAANKPCLLYTSPSPRD